MLKTEFKMKDGKYNLIITEETEQKVNKEFNKLEEAVEKELNYRENYYDFKFSEEMKKVFIEKTRLELEYEEVKSESTYYKMLNQGNVLDEILTDSGYYSKVLLRELPPNVKELFGLNYEDFVAIEEANLRVK